MKNPSTSVRYLGFRTLSGGGRLLDFSFTDADASQQAISFTVSLDLLRGPDHLSFQECAAICFETLKARILSSGEIIPASIKLAPEDIIKHRKVGRR